MRPLLRVSLRSRQVGDFRPVPRRTLALVKVRRTENRDDLRALFRELFRSGADAGTPVVAFERHASQPDAARQKVDAAGYSASRPRIG